MSTTRLLVLGGVRRFGRAHGYEVRRELMSWGSDEWAHVNPGSIYHALRQLAKEGLLRAHDVEESDAGPPHTDYEITEEGRAEFLRLLRCAIATVDVRHPEMLTAGLGFLTELTRAEALRLLRERLDGLAAWRASIAPLQDQQDPADHLRELLGWWIHSAESATAWTEGLIGRLESGAYRMAEDPR
ncbi:MULTISPECIES: PadR family transcriptional regulator [Actinomadura]|uniref:PadR family transcriptional regulator n=1 Tax=Actinomadura litoris TaxID=2678616 RepID=A0A7K1KWF3_9ACTN|nr:MULTISPECIES: PadR family transcriptional regulator [Actinomadura]MBT2211473.1 PadR family transcriptional regulator [Actinomadura sp. NEAU-AAG7]MUN36387.1 PadR family transcriptional regulator [Actinomadura litoris]